MKTAITILFLVALLCGCNKPAAVPPVVQAAKEPKSVQWEYKVVLDYIPPVVASLARAKTGLADAQQDLALSKIGLKVALHQISPDAADAATNNAGGDWELKITQIEIEQENGVRTNLLHSITSQSTNSWELVTANISPEKPDKIILIFKRPSQ